MLRSEDQEEGRNPLVLPPGVGPVCLGPLSIGPILSLSRAAPGHKKLI